MKLTHLLIAGAVALAALCSCTGSKEPSALIAQSERISADLGTLAQESPMFLQSAAADYDDGTLSVEIAFADSLVNVNDCSEALVQYVLAQYLKAHTGKNLDTVLNTLSKEKGSLALKLSDVLGNSREYPVSASRLVQLVRLKPMELNYNDVRTNVSDILAKKCAAYKAQYNADDCEFEITGGFAQYTLTFAKASAFASLSQANLAARYVKDINPTYEDFGACRSMVEDLLRSLSIDGYRFVYTDKSGAKRLSAGIPWRLIK